MTISEAQETRELQGSPHEIDGVGDLLVLPDADDCPSGFGQRRRRLLVALNSAGKLGRPVPLVCGGLSPMLGAGVPETAVDKHRNLARGEDDVGPDAPVRKVDPEVFTEPVAKPVQPGAELDLRLGIRAANRTHIAGAPITGRLGPLTRSFSAHRLLRCVLHTVSVLRAEPFTNRVRDTERWTPAACSHVAIQEGLR